MSLYLANGCSRAIPRLLLDSAADFGPNDDDDTDSGEVSEETQTVAEAETVAGTVQFRVQLGNKNLTDKPTWPQVAMVTPPPPCGCALFIRVE